MNSALDFHPDEIFLSQILARKKSPEDPRDIAGYSISLSLANSERIDNPGTSNHPKMRFLLECLAWEMSEIPGDESSVEMSVDVDNPATNAEVQLLFSLTFTTNEDPNNDSVSQDEANGLLEKSFRFAYPYMRERMRLASFDVFRRPLILPLNFDEIDQVPQP